jgi:hypothetical protein
MGEICNMHGGAIDYIPKEKHILDRTDSVARRIHHLLGHVA